MRINGETVSKQQPSLFAKSKAPAPAHTRIGCAGCPATATVIARAGPPALATGWVACGSTSEGELAVWCGQCAYEGRHLTWVSNATEATPATTATARDRSVGPMRRRNTSGDE